MQRQKYKEMSHFPKCKYKKKKKKTAERAYQQIHLKII